MRTTDDHHFEHIKLLDCGDFALTIIILTAKIKFLSTLGSSQHSRSFTLDSGTSIDRPKSHGCRILVIRGYFNDLPFLLLTPNCSSDSNYCGCSFMAVPVLLALVDDGNWLFVFVRRNDNVLSFGRSVCNQFD